MRCVAVTALGALIGLSATAAAEIVVTISKSQQRLAVTVDGTELYRWPVSTGQRGLETPSGVFHPKSMNRIWYSRQFGLTPMPWSVFFHRGFAVHGTSDERNLGRPVSHGCVRLQSENASILYSLVQEQGFANTKLIVSNDPLPPSPYAVPMAESGGRAEAAAKVAAKPAPAGEIHRAAKADREDRMRLAARSDRAEAVHAAPKGDREDIGRLSALSDREDLSHPPRSTATARWQMVAHGDDAHVLRDREAWLRALAHKYGFSKW